MLGLSAGLESLREYHQNQPTSQSLPSGNDTTCTTSNEEKVQYLRENIETEEDEEEQLLHHVPWARVGLVIPEPSTHSSHSFQNIVGRLIITTERIFFITATPSDGSLYDFCMDATCILLHATTSDPESSIYCQMLGDSIVPPDDDNNINNNDDGDDDGTSNIIIFNRQDDTIEEDDDDAQDGTSSSIPPMELTLIPCSPPPKKENGATGAYEMNEEEMNEACQGLFHSISKLISLNPIDEDEDGGGGDCGGLVAMLNMMARGASSTMDDAANEDNDDGDMICRIDPNEVHGLVNASNTSATTRGSSSDNVPSIEERNAMLQRLDDMLIVPPEYEVKEDEDVSGQFDDAEEDDDPLL